MFSYDTAAAIYRCPENNETAIIVPNQAGEVEPFFVNTLFCLFVSFSVSNIRMAADLVTENTLFTSVGAVVTEDALLNCLIINF